MSDELKMKLLAEILTARNAVRLARLKAENADMHARLLTNQVRTHLSELPEIFHRHLQARFDFQATV